MYVIGGYIAIGKPELKTDGAIDAGGRAAIAFCEFWRLATTVWLRRWGLVLTLLLF